MSLTLVPGFATPAECEAIVAAFEACPTPRFKSDRRTEISARDIACPELLAVRRRMMEAVPGQPDYTVLTAMYPGDAHARHADNERRTAAGGWEPNHTAWRVHSTLLYLNTQGEDYDGGLFRFHLLSQTIKTTQGMFLAFPADRRYEHEVAPVTRGVRRTIAMWTTFTSAHYETL